MDAAVHMMEKRVGHSSQFERQTHEWTNKCPTCEARKSAREPQMLYETDRDVTDTWKRLHWDYKFTKVMLMEGVRSFDGGEGTGGQQKVREAECRFW